MNIKEEYIFKRLKKSTKPIVMYGTGDGGDKLIDTCAAFGIDIHSVFASDDFARNRVFRGYAVKKYADICAELDDFTVLVAFGTNRDDVMQHIIDMSREHEVLIPDLPLFDKVLFTDDYLNSHIDEFEHTYSMLADECSKKLFDDIINYKLSGKLEYLMNFTDVSKDLKKLCPKDDPFFVDIGAYRGDTIAEFINEFPGYSGVAAFEPDAKTFKKLEAFCKDIKAELFHAAASDNSAPVEFAIKKGRGSSAGEGALVNAITVDEALLLRCVDIIKIDAEGMDEKALLGCKETIKKHRPALIISVYHKADDLIRLPQIAEKFGYSLYLRRRKCFPMWDILLYAIDGIIA